ncbi:hypothetical protein D3C72_1597460 [compost metagenome]
MALTQPTATGLAKPSDLTMVGSQKLIAYTPIWMQKYTRPSIHTCLLRSTLAKVSAVFAPLRRWRSSSSRSARSSCFSSVLSHFAWAMPSFSSTYTRKPSSTVGMPCSRNIHCQPARPPWPANDCIIQPDKGLPSKPEMGMADMNRPMMRPRRDAGYQFVKYSTMPGKKPASNTPVMKRSE